MAFRERLDRRRELLGPDSPFTSAARNEFAYWLSIADSIPGTVSQQTLHSVLLREDSLAVRLLETGTDIPRHDLLRYSTTLYERVSSLISVRHSNPLAGFSDDQVERLFRLTPGSVHLGSLLGASLFVLSLDTIVDQDIWNPDASVLASLTEHFGFSAERLTHSLRSGESGMAALKRQLPMLTVSLDDTGRVIVVPMLNSGHHPFINSESGSVTTVNLLLPTFTFFTDDELGEFSDLLSSTAASESDYQAFFGRRPSFLYLLGHYDDFKREVELPYQVSHGQELKIQSDVSFAPSAGDRSGRLDFMLRRSWIDRWDLVELKLPTVTLIVGRGRRSTFSHQVHLAISQLRDYTRALQERGVKDYLQDRYGIRVSSPRPFLVIGRDRGDAMVADRIEKLSRDEAEDIGLYTYDSILRMAQRRRICAKALHPQTRSDE